MIMLSYKEQIAAKLRRLRESEGISIREAAGRVTDAKFACSHMTWYRWECGEVAPPSDALPAIADAFKKQIVSLLP